jgi:metal-responsive CopG/Arc/MetJ family transcriptional regulator
MAVYKVNISLPEGLVSEIDEVAGELGMTRSGFVAEASARYVADVKNLSAEEQRSSDIARALATYRRIGAQIPADFDGVAQIRRDRERDTERGDER